MAPHLHGAPRPCGIGSKRHLEDQAARELDHVPYMNVSIHSQPVVLAESGSGAAYAIPSGKGLETDGLTQNEAIERAVRGSRRPGTDCSIVRL